MEINARKRELNNLYNSPVGKLAIEELSDYVTDSATGNINSDVLKGMCLILAHVKELAKIERT